MQFTFNLEQRNTYTYAAYRDLIDHLLQNNKTTGDNYSEAYLDYTQMNVHRMERLDKHIEIHPDVVEQLVKAQKQTWIVLTEAWCGDAAQNIPIIAKMAAKSEHINLQLILRDENLDIMDAYLTNGKSRSIPKLIAVAENGEELFTWGPRPSTIQNLYTSLREEGLVYATIAEKVHLAYARDKTKELQDEIKELLQKTVSGLRV